jgi:hypothetical protein
LQLVTEIIKQTYCDGPDPELLSLRFLLRLSFTNIGKRQLILERGQKQVPVIRVSKTAENAIVHRFEATINNYIITGNSMAPTSLKIRTFSSLVVLPPGESYRTIAEVSVLVPRANPAPSVINPGHHYLQIGVWTWDESQREAKVIRRKWRKKGILWSQTVESKPMPFTVVPQPNPEDCRCPDPKINQVQAIDIAARKMSMSQQSVSSYSPTAFEQGCEWHVVFSANAKDNNRASLTYVIDKNSGKILVELR